MAVWAEVWYLAHSGFAVRVPDAFLIFDYYNDTPVKNMRSLDSGVINPEEIKSERVLFFSSHRHHDHFNPVIMSWGDRLPHAEYFLSSDIPVRFHRERTHVLKPYQGYETPGIKIQTYKSTDQGVAFLVTINRITVFHAGDLNWWHWDGESKAWNNNMAARFKHEVSLMKDASIDLAFFPADPRLKRAQLWGLIWFLENVSVKTAFPMHFWENFGIMEHIRAEAAAHPVLGKVKQISARGEHFKIMVR